MPEEILTLTDDQIVVVRLPKSNVPSEPRNIAGPDDVDAEGNDSTGENDADPSVMP